MPTTVWTLPGLDDSWDAGLDLGTGRAGHVALPQRIRRVLTAFGHPANTLILADTDTDIDTDTVVGDPTESDAGCRDACGPDPVRADPAHGADPTERPHARTSDSAPETRLPGPQLVVLDLGCRGLDDRSAAAVAADVGPGGTLAVLTHSHRDRGRLIDRTGVVIAALQDADLLYLQHIVIVEHPLSPLPDPARPGSRDESTAHTVAAGDHAADHAADDGDRPGRGLVDLTVFVQPGSPPQAELENGVAG